MFLKQINLINLLYVKKKKTGNNPMKVTQASWWRKNIDFFQ